MRNERPQMCPDHPGSPLGHCGYYLNKPHNWTTEKDTTLTPEQLVTQIRENFITESIRFAQRYRKPIDEALLRQTALILFPDEPTEK